MILSIESSCDDSSLALTRIDDGALLYHIKISQDEAHSTYGGIVPEIASRLHAQRLPEILEKLKIFLHNDLSPIKAIAVTTRPGLSVTLIEGLMMAKTLCLGLNVPLICVNHLKGHIYSLFIKDETNAPLPRTIESTPLNPQSLLPLGILLVSGGHTQILKMYDFNHIALIAQTLDDSFGESFDKVAKYLGLGYPGGPIIESYARTFKGQYPHLRAQHFPIPLARNKKVQFSFSGLKNAVRLALQDLPKPLSEANMASICAGFQEAACHHITQKCELFFKEQKKQDLKHSGLAEDSKERCAHLKHFAIVGGASANSTLREKLAQLCAQYDITLHLAPLAFCADNAAMIGRVGVEHYKMGDFTPLFSAQIAPKSIEGDFMADSILG
ncbi:tRNA (adenosine(37)-N6)-threonylcarbamoyltransferase complex transferase subunit TsaD [Helicobacter jaachi]|uniref:tRNA N6-adenosine threonylcarbamoyltransferase n=1 Tax=Helicobacter jaachi TaxID=1677920 RepID=A0A4U8TA81_9HELI|nr:tRNA (adenosine(37)-N6)-threonylcarbamoyltransferase complex transferase subunit TsaD [Helicobacter jaachi]TLD96574.1 tRNA (adenosine(37)-N6)-threonylcarbamoyltransferase complex transferase subunit TsaD [Helicobacter jaachi]